MLISHITVRLMMQLQRNSSANVRYSHGLREQALHKREIDELSIFISPLSLTGILNPLLLRAIKLVILAHFLA